MFFLCATKEELKGHLRGHCQMLNPIPHTTQAFPPMVLQGINLSALSYSCSHPSSSPYQPPRPLCSLTATHRVDTWMYFYHLGCAECLNQHQHTNPHHQIKTYYTYMAWEPEKHIFHCWTCCLAVLPVSKDSFPLPLLSWSGNLGVSATSLPLPAGKVHPGNKW